MWTTRKVAAQAAVLLLLLIVAHETAVPVPAAAARECGKGRSKRFTDFCISNDKCARVCGEEGWNGGGKCEGLWRGRYCTCVRNC